VRQVLKKCLRSCKRLGYGVVVRAAPKCAVTFDRMIVVFTAKDRKNILKVVLYDSRTDDIVQMISA
jgi:hypothetical protein